MESQPLPPPLPGKMKALLGEALKMFTFATDPIRITPRVIKQKIVICSPLEHGKPVIFCNYKIIDLLIYWGFHEKVTLSYIPV